MIHSYLEKRRPKKVLGASVHPEAMEAIIRARGADNELHTFTAAHIEFVLVFVDGKTPDEISERVGRVAEIAMSNDGTVHDIIGALVVITLGAHPVISKPTGGKRAALVEHLRRELSSCAKIVHGAADGHFGSVGSGKRMACSFILPHFDATLGKLSQIAFGQVEEFEK